VIAPASLDFLLQLLALPLEPLPLPLEPAINPTRLRAFSHRGVSL
jgi:hypothetical protein